MMSAKEAKFEPRRSLNISPINHSSPNLGLISKKQLKKLEKVEEYKKQINKLRRELKYLQKQKNKLQNKHEK